MLSSPSSSEKESNSQPSGLKPKKFLKKGEGLKRFAAYNPPPPTTARKMERRKTLVKFKLDEFHPELFANDSINLSTEIPIIAPPKIIHTPVKTRPCQTTRYYCDDFLDRHKELEPDADLVVESEPVSEKNQEIIDDKLHRNEDNEEDEEEPAQDSKIKKLSKNSRRYNLRGGKKKDSPGPPGDPSEFQKKEPRKNSRKIIVESDKRVPKDMNTIARHIQIIQSTANELKENISACECGKLCFVGPIKTDPLSTNSLTKIPKKGSRLSKKSIDTRHQVARQTVDSAATITPELVNTLLYEIANLKASFDEIKSKN